MIVHSSLAGNEEPMRARFNDMLKNPTNYEITLPSGTYRMDLAEASILNDDGTLDYLPSDVIDFVEFKL